MLLFASATTCFLPGILRRSIIDKFLGFHVLIDRRYEHQPSFLAVYVDFHRIRGCYGTSLADVEVLKRFFQWHRLFTLIQRVLSSVGKHISIMLIHVNIQIYFITSPSMAAAELVFVLWVSSKLLQVHWPEVVPI